MKRARDWVASPDVSVGSSAFWCPVSTDKVKCLRVDIGVVTWSIHQAEI